MHVTMESASLKAAAVPVSPVVKRHSVTTRVTHWIVALAMLVLIMSGLQIFNAAPYLDDSDLSSPRHRILSFGTAGGQGTVGTTTVFGHQFATTNCWLYR